MAEAIGGFAVLAIVTELLRHGRVHGEIHPHLDAHREGGGEPDGEDPGVAIEEASRSPEEPREGA